MGGSQAMLLPTDVPGQTMTMTMKNENNDKEYEDSWIHCHHWHCHPWYWSLPAQPMTFTMLRSDVPSSHRIQKPTPHTSLRPNVPTVAARVKVKEVKAVAVVKPLYNVPTTVASQSYCLQLPGKNPEVVPASEGGRHNHWYCL